MFSAKKRLAFPILMLPLLASLLGACVRPAPASQIWMPARGGGPQDVTSAQLSSLPTQVPPTLPAATAVPGNNPVVPPTLAAPTAEANGPTPDPPHTLPTARTSTDVYTVQQGDTMNKIAQHFQIGLKSLIQANPTVDPNIVYVGTILSIPAPSAADLGSSFKIIPDSELVYGPGEATFDTLAFIKKYDSYLSRFHETVDDQDTYGPQIVDRIAHEYSVNPRLLLALIEYQSGWLTQANPSSAKNPYPMGLADSVHVGLYRQLSWVADNLNRGFYLWMANGISNLSLADGNITPIAATVNPGTVGVQNLFAGLLGDQAWRKAVSKDGFIQVYRQLFGDPFQYAVEPLLPAGLQQPKMQLPFANGDAWSFTGGPHGGWAEGSAWAAIDFAPPGESLGCYVSPTWSVAVSDGLIVRTGDGGVIEDLDGDGHEQTGWTVLYMHMSSAGRVQTGTTVHAGDPIGHPSCEGGVSNGTHMHIARRYNGVWIAADGNLPFNLDGWVSSGNQGVEYDGFLTRNDQSIEAWDGRSPANQIQR